MKQRIWVIRINDGSIPDRIEWRNIVMKKIAAVTAAIAAAVCTATGVMAAATPEPTKAPDVKSKITVTSDKSSGISLENKTYDKEAASIKKALISTNGLSAVYATEKQKFQIKSESDGKQPIDVYLRLSTTSDAVNAEYDSKKALTTYSITIKDGDNVIYNSNEKQADVTSPKKGEYVMDVYLGRFNESEIEDLKEYSIDVLVPQGTTASQVKNAKKVDWEIVSDPVEDTAVPAPTFAVKATAVPTEAPKATTVPQTETAAPVTPTPQVVTPAPAATPTQAATAVPATTVPAATELSDGTNSKTVGTGKDQVAPGTYTVTSKDKDKDVTVKVYNSDGKLDKEIQLTSKKPSQVVTLKAGQKIEYSSPINLTTYKSPTAAPSATAKTAAKATATPKATATAAPKDAKKNPKTGDTAPIAGASALAMFALGMMAYPEIEKRRKNN